ncbi:hypothetical protein DP804_19465 [Salmonella enterica subsp. enterica]|nr:hypothetical protein [Salmonella enterica subsp. enterica serovar Virchow]
MLVNKSRKKRCCVFYSVDKAGLLPCFFHFCGSLSVSSASFFTLSVMSSGSPRSQPQTGL